MLNCGFAVAGSTTSSFESLLWPFLFQFTNLIQDERLTVQELDRLAAIAGETIDRLNLKYQDEKKP